MSKSRKKNKKVYLLDLDYLFDQLTPNGNRLQEREMYKQVVDISPILLALKHSSKGYIIKDKEGNYYKYDTIMNLIPSLATMVGEFKCKKGLLPAGTRLLLEKNGVISGEKKLTLY